MGDCQRSGLVTVVVVAVDGIVASVRAASGIVEAGRFLGRWIPSVSCSFERPYNHRLEPTRPTVCAIISLRRAAQAARYANRSGPNPDSIRTALSIDTRHVTQYIPA